MPTPIAALALALAPHPTLQDAPRQGAPLHPATPVVSSQGLLTERDGQRVRRSPRGSLELRLEALEGDFHSLWFALDVRTADGRTAHIPRVAGNGFFASDLDAIVVLEAHEPAAHPTRLTLLDLSGRTLAQREVAQLADAQMSPDGAFLAFRSREGTVVLDLDTLAERTHPSLLHFAVGARGTLAGVGADAARVLEVFDPGSPEGSEVSGTVGRRRFPLQHAPMRLSFSSDGRSLFALSRERLLAIDLTSGAQRVLHEAAVGEELRDLRAGAAGIFLGARRGDARTSTGSLLRIAERDLDAPGGAGAQLVATRRQSLPPAFPAVPFPLGLAPPLDWPLAPNSQHPIGNSYAEYQNYGGAPYMHPGIDVLGDPGQPVYAVADGFVKAFLTTSGSYHWRLAIGSSAGPEPSNGYLYAHLEQSSVPVAVGDPVARGQYIGDLVPWPVSGFTHTHFARIRHSGIVWDGAWLNTDNPHPELAHLSDAVAPLFEPARGADLFAFCTNETSTYLDPDALVGEVDIIARVSDEIASTWRCDVQEIRYTIHPLGMPASPVVDDKLAVRFDMPLDTYADGPIDPLMVDIVYKQDSTCPTRGDYSNREFYHVITNSNGDDIYDASDMAQAWDTTTLSDGSYRVRVRARDAAGNTSTASMVVQTANGNP